MLLSSVLKVRTRVGLKYIIVRFSLASVKFYCSLMSGFQKCKYYGC